MGLGETGVEERVEKNMVNRGGGQDVDGRR